jgi:two-component system, OmpR family, response regulator BaeR
MMRRTWAAGAEIAPPPRALHVVVVETGPRSTSALMALLLGEAFTVSRVGDVAAAVHAATRDAPDAVLIDACLRAVNAIDLCRALRRCSDVPILVLAGDAQTAQRIDAERCGADLCLAEPQPPGELTAGLLSLLGHVPARPLRAPWRLDRRARTVAIGWCPLDLTPTEFRVLETLLLAEGKTLSREALLDCIQAERRDVCDRAIDVHVRSLRRKIAAVLPGHDRIVSVYGVGYRFEP